MSIYPETPVIVTGQADENPADDVGDMQSLLPNVDKNYADDPEVKAQVLHEIVPVVEAAKNQRIQLEEEWKAIRRMLMLVHDEGQRYLGRSNAYVPAYAQALITLVSKVSRGLFPSDEYMDVNSRQDADPEAARPVKQYLQYEFEKVAKLRANIKPFLREFFNFGIAIGKYWYEPAKLANRKVGKLSLNAVGQEEVTYGDDSSSEGLRFSTRSIFNWYMWPPTAANIKEATLVAEDIDVTRQFIREMGRIGEWKNTEAMLHESNDTTHDQNQRDLMDDTMRNSSVGPGSAVQGTELGDVRTVTEVWTRLKLPKSAYAQGEDPECPLMVKVEYAGNTVLSVKRNPFWHQEFPYLVARMEVLPGSFYPKGSGHRARAMQYLVNDFTNQLNDNGTYAMNPIIKVNPGTLAGPMSPLRPGAVYSTTDTANGIVFDRPPIEQLQYGIQLVSSYSGMLQDYVGAPPMLQGSGAGKGAKTATGAQILQANASNPIQDLVEDIENDVLMPLMYGTWMLGQQYRRADVMDDIAGARIKVSRSQLAGDYTFRWLASSQAANQQQRAQQAISLLQVIQPLAEMVMQNGYVIDPVPLLKRVYSDGFGFRGFDQFVKPMPQQPQMAGGMPPGALPPGQMPPEQVGASLGNARSALEQTYGAGQEMVPGEGEEFANVRDEADDLAATFGGNQ